MPNHVSTETFNSAFFLLFQIFDIQFNLFEENEIVSCGIKHINFWRFCGNSLQSRKGVFGKVGEIQTLLCLAFGPNHTTYSGTLSGDIYVWSGNNLESIISDAHQVSFFFFSKLFCSNLIIYVFICICQDKNDKKHLQTKCLCKYQPISILDACDKIMWFFAFDHLQIIAI